GQPFGQPHGLHHARDVGVREGERAVVVDAHIQEPFESLLGRRQQRGGVDRLRHHAEPPPFGRAASTAAPKRRSRLAYSRHASHNFLRSKSGKSVSWKTNSAYADCHNRKFEVRSSPEGRRKRSTSGISG